MKRPRSKFTHGGARCHAGHKPVTLQGFVRTLSTTDAERVRRGIRSVAWTEIRDVVENVIAKPESCDEPHLRNRNPAQ